MAKRKDTLRRKLDKRGLTCSWLAAKLEISDDTVRSWSCGRSQPCCKYMQWAIDDELAEYDKDNGR